MWEGNGGARIPHRALTGPCVIQRTSWCQQPRDKSAAINILTHVARESEEAGWGVGRGLLCGVPRKGLVEGGGLVPPHGDVQVRQAENSFRWTDRKEKGQDESGEREAGLERNVLD